MNKIKKIILCYIFTVFSCAIIFSQSNTTASNAGANNLLISSAETASLISETNRGAASLNPTPQLALSTSEYRVTAGDVYSLAFAAGSTPVTYSIPVDSSYKIRVANLAVINANGKTFSQLKTQIEEIVTKNYPMSGVQFVLVTPAVFKVTICGEVKQTEIRQAWALTRLSTAIAETYTTYSSNRDIIIESANGTRKTYDLFKASRFGDLSQDPYLRPDDKIIIGKLKRTVLITGAVERPGTYTLLDGENLQALIDYYGGGLTEYADTSRIEVVRYNPTDISNQALYLDQKSIDSDFELLSHDTVRISISTELLPVMFIEGAIIDKSMGDNTTDTQAAGNSKKTVRFNPDTNYAYLVRQQENIFDSISDLENAFIIRGDKTISIDLSKMLYDRSYYSEEIVQPNDTLMVPFKQNFVSVAGAVRNPGRYPYISGRDWEYYVGLAGGFDRSMNTGAKIEIVDRNGKRLKKSDPITPETTITAQTNSFTYYFNRYATVVTTILSLISSIISIILITTK